MEKKEKIEKMNLEVKENLKLTDEEYEKTKDVLSRLNEIELEANPELIEKILVMHGKQQQKQQEDLDDAAVYRICGDIRMRFQEEQ